MLTLESVVAGYGESQVLNGIGFGVGAAQVVTLLGRNGMGKTTTVRAILGLIRPSAGHIRFNGQDISGDPPYRIAQRGIGLVPEGRQIFPTLSVEENLVATAANRTGGAPRWDLPAIYALFPRLAERRRQSGAKLSGGEQQMLAIGRALMARPKLLLLDEPSLGLAPLIVKQIFDTIRELNQKEGLTVFLVEQNAYHALKLAHRGYVMVNGVITMTGTGQELLANPQVRAAYLEGGSH
jgi:branched-chain amino acid transport system ATP-binding protein